MENNIVSFSDWMLNKSTIIGDEKIEVQAGGDTVKEQAGGNPSRKVKQTPDNKIQNKDIAIYDSGVAKPTGTEKIDAPAVYDTDFNKQSNAVVADTQQDIFTPQVDLTDIFSVSYNPQLDN